MLELVVLVFNRSLQPVLTVQIHHDAALVEALMALCEVGLDHEAEELLTRLHLQYRCIVVLEMVVGALPQVGVGCRRDDKRVAFNLKTARFPCPLKAVQVDTATIGQCQLNIVGKCFARLLLSLLSTAHKHEAKAEQCENVFVHGYIHFV